MIIIYAKTTRRQKTRNNLAHFGFENYLSSWRKSKKKFLLKSKTENRLKKYFFSYMRKRDEKLFLNYSQKHNIFHSQKTTFCLLFSFLFSHHIQNCSNRQDEKNLTRKNHFSLILYFNASSLQYFLCCVARCGKILSS